MIFINIIAEKIGVFAENTAASYCKKIGYR
jgi:hypothetical protein